MKKKTTKIRSSRFKYLLFLPILLLSFCESNLEGPALSSENRLNKDAKVLALMKAAIKSDSDQNLIKNKGILSKSSATDEDDQCTHFLYPMEFDVYSGDDPDPVLREINSDEELITFIDTFTSEDTLIASTTNFEFYIFFPITLLDTDGVKTELWNLTELEGTLQMAVEACASFNDDSSGGNGGNDDGDNNDSNDRSSSSSNDGNDDDDCNSYEYCDKKEKKVYICHKGKTICISVNAIWGHMQHHEEDYCGRCVD